MKKILVFLLLIIALNVYSVIYVPGDYSTIQAAINAASSVDEISISGGPYNESINLLNKTLYIHKRYSSNVTINGGNSTTVINMGYANSSHLSGLNITSSSSTNGIYINSINNIEIDDCEIESVDYGIYINEGDEVAISDCEISDTDYGIHINDDHPYQVDVDVFTSVFHDNGSAIYIDNNYLLYLLGCLFHSNTKAFEIAGAAQNNCNMDRATISDNTNGIVWGSNADFYIANSIVYDNTTNFSGTPYDLDCDYSDIEGGYTGTDNINADPYFCMETGYEYRLMEGSPCIDTGDPTITTGVDVRADMGCFETTYDVKECEGQSWNWVSYPRLYREDDDGVDATDTLEEFLDWPFHLEMLYDLLVWDDPTLEYYIGTWSPTSYYVYSSKGYKLDPDDSGDHYLPTATNASRLPANWILDYTLEEDYCWMGYWLPYTQNIEDAFGELFDELVSVSSEDWYYEYSIFETPSSSTTNKNMVYGKGYVVVFETDIEDFCWTDATIGRSYGSPGNPEPKPQYFEFADLPNYEAIDIMEIPSNVVEIGVYEEETCIAAVVVQEEDEQILAYSTNANRDNVPLTFQVVTTNRGENLAVSDYRVMNKETGRWENRSLISGSQRSSVVMFGNLEEPATPNSSFQISNLSNYPNPFNPTTTISFDLSSELTEDVEVAIYNMKGQKVKTLPVSPSQSLSVSVTWDGTDNEGKNVSSGLYLYKLKTDDHEYSKKMLLLK